MHALTEKGRVGGGEAERRSGLSANVGHLHQTPYHLAVQGLIRQPLHTNLHMCKVSARA